VQDAPARHGITAGLIMCFMRDLGAASAAEVLQMVRLAAWFALLQKWTAPLPACFQPCVAFLPLNHPQVMTQLVARAAAAPAPKL
jgi:hypothetical protein